ncbi:MAG: DNA primase DnaG [Candidatus Pacearchaeota archaeon]
MGKVSPPSIKYIIHATFVAEGVVEKPDVIGAIFGQTEGLLGEELELRELQKKGKIGRIDATLNIVDSKTTGTVEIPTSIDKAETAIIAAAIETVDRIGPCEAKFEIKDIEDVRISKREYIIERAKKLMENFIDKAPSIKEIEQNIIAHTRVAKVREYGKELLAAGPDVEIANEIIVVEGRADVVALLKAGIKNVIAMNGTSMPATIKELSKEKEVTLFIDGDRGGLLIAKNAIESTNIAFIARAPDGKEVEELTEKEIISCLRNRMTIDEFKDKYMKMEKQEIMTRAKRERVGEIKKENYKGKRETKDLDYNKKIEVSDKLLEKNMQNLQGWLYEIDGTKSALVLGLNGNDSNFKVLKRSSLNEVSRTLLKTREAIGLIIDGTATLNIIRAAEKKNCKFIVAKNFATTSKILKLISF